MCGSYRILSSATDQDEMNKTQCDHIEARFENCTVSKVQKILDFSLELVCVGCHLPDRRSHSNSLRMNWPVFFSLKT